VRSEQAATAAMQRELTLRGALAVLYGRHSKYYIRQSEVGVQIFLIKRTQTLTCNALVLCSVGEGPVGSFSLRSFSVL
jgi:hypothetical protein